MSRLCEHANLAARVDVSREEGPRPSFWAAVSIRCSACGCSFVARPAGAGRFQVVPIIGSQEPRRTETEDDAA